MIFLNKYYFSFMFKNNIWVFWKTKFFELHHFTNKCLICIYFTTVNIAYFPKDNAANITLINSKYNFNHHSKYNINHESMSYKVFYVLRSQKKKKEIYYGQKIIYIMFISDNNTNKSKEQIPFKRDLSRKTIAFDALKDVMLYWTLQQKL